jgi:hypothetical protein
MERNIDCCLPVAKWVGFGAHRRYYEPRSRPRIVEASQPALKLSFNRPDQISAGPGVTAVVIILMMMPFICSCRNNREFFVKELDSEGCSERPRPNPLFYLSLRVWRMFYSMISSTMSSTQKTCQSRGPLPLCQILFQGSRRKSVLHVNKVRLLRSMLSGIMRQTQL